MVGRGLQARTHLSGREVEAQESRLRCAPSLDQHYESHILDKAECAAKGLTFARPLVVPPSHGAALHVPSRPRSQGPAGSRDRPWEARTQAPHGPPCPPRAAWPHGRLVVEARGSRPGLAH